MTTSRLVGHTIKAVLEMSIVDFPHAAPLIVKGTITHGGWTVCVETNDPLDMTTETREQLNALVACASANGYQIGQTYKWVRVKRKVNQGAQKFVHRMCEPPPRYLNAARLAAVDATLRAAYRDAQISMYAVNPLITLAGLSAKVP